MEGVPETSSIVSQDSKSDLLNQKKTRWMDNATTIILALASVLSAWLSYQSGQWDHKQSRYLEEESAVLNKRLQSQLSAAQRQAIDINFILNYFSAKTTGNKKLEDQLFLWFPPHLKKAYLAWNSIDSLKNTNRTTNPMKIKEYIIPEKLEAEKYASEAEELKKVALHADRISGVYLRLSIVVAMVLFFTGLAGVANSNHTKRIMLLFSLTLLVWVILSTLRYPIEIDFHL